MNTLRLLGSTEHTVFLTALQDSEQKHEVQHQHECGCSSQRSTRLVACPRTKNTGRAGTSRHGSSPPASVRCRTERARCRRSSCRRAQRCSAWQRRSQPGAAERQRAGLRRRRRSRRSRCRGRSLYRVRAVAGLPVSDGGFRVVGPLERSLSIPVETSAATARRVSSLPMEVVALCAWPCSAPGFNRRPRWKKPRRNLDGAWNSSALHLCLVIQHC